jgi:hypothetical protein
MPIVCTRNVDKLGPASSKFSSFKKKKFIKFPVSLVGRKSELSHIVNFPTSNCCATWLVLPILILAGPTPDTIREKKRKLGNSDRVEHLSIDPMTKEMSRKLGLNFTHTRITERRLNLWAGPEFPPLNDRRGGGGGYWC